MANELVAFILTHGRPNNIKTLQTLKRRGFTGDIYFIVDTEDESLNIYKELYGDKVIVFDKSEIAKRFDQGDNFQDRRTIFYARNACYDIAEKLGIRYFIQLDDDYTDFSYVYTHEQKFKRKIINKLDIVFAVLLEFYKSIPALSVCVAQGGDFIGGKEGGFAKGITCKRKAMNTFICDTERRFVFVGRVNEDVNTYVSEGSRGGLFLTVSPVQVNQVMTQTNKGGMTEQYLDSGTYVKSFYTVMYAPSCTKITLLRGQKNSRIHHEIDWDRAVPKIIREIEY